MSMWPSGSRERMAEARPERRYGEKEPRRFEIERDRFALMCSREPPLEVGECIEVIEVSCPPDERETVPKAEHKAALAKVRELHRALSEGYGVEDGGIWEDRALEAEARLSRYETALQECEKGLGSLLWVMNNRHNWADPKWDGLAEASEEDARRALTQARAALDASPSPKPDAASSQTPGE